MTTDDVLARRAGLLLAMTSAADECSERLGDLGDPGEATDPLVAAADDPDEDADGTAEDQTEPSGVPSDPALLRVAAAQASAQERMTAARMRRLLQSPMIWTAEPALPLAELLHLEQTWPVVESAPGRTAELDRPELAEPVAVGPVTTPPAAVPPITAPVTAESTAAEPTSQAPSADDGPVDDGPADSSPADDASADPTVVTADRPARRRPGSGRPGGPRAGSGRPAPRADRPGPAGPGPAARPRYRRMAAVSLAACGVVIAFLAAWLVVATPEETMRFQLAGSGSTSEVHASVTATKKNAGWRLVLDIRGLPGAPPNMYYEGWVSKGDTYVPLGTFHMRKPGQVELWSGVALSDFASVVVTRQQIDLGQQPAQVVLAGTIPESDPE